MDGVFSLPEPARTLFLRSLLHSLGCAYICLWRYNSNLFNRLIFLDGLLSNVTNNQPSSSSSSSLELERSSTTTTAAESLFSQYQRLTFDVNNDCVPGLAFRNHLPYLELQQSDLLRLTSTQIQTQFFQEARIKTAVFMGCNKGEIELGFSNMSPQGDIQTTLGNIFPEDFCIRYSQSIIDHQNLRASSSSSSLISATTTASSPHEYYYSSSLLFNNIIPASTSQLVIPTTKQQYQTSTTPYHYHQQITNNIQLELDDQAINHPRHQLIPTTPEGEQDAIIGALLHVISSSSPSSHDDQQHQQHNLPHPHTNSLVHIPEATTAFKRYTIGPSPTITSPQMGSNFQRQSLMNRSLAFFRNLNSMRIMRQRNIIQEGSRPAPSTQLHHHVISERRRREKLNENFQALRALLPPGTKRDKASILRAAKETMSSLMAEIEKLSMRNQNLMMTRLSTAKEATTTDHDQEINKASSSNETLSVWVSDYVYSGSELASSSGEEMRMVELRVSVRSGGESSQVDILTTRLLEFLKRVQNVTLISMAANTHITQGTTAINQLITFRLSIIEGSEWDESAFQEAVRRVVADLIQWQGN